jgi:hypothetical protein
MVVAVIDVPQTPRRPNPNRRVVHATCSTHGRVIGFTNMVVTKRDRRIELDPHITGQPRVFTLSFRSWVLRVSERGRVSLT